MGGYIVFFDVPPCATYFRAMVLADTESQATRRRRSPDAEYAAVGARQGVAAIADALPKLVGDTTRRERPALSTRCGQITGNSAESMPAH
jgi:hypothetical protein